MSNFYSFLIFYLTYAAGRANILHLEGRANIFSTEDPGFVIVNVTHPDSAITFFDVDKKGFVFLPVGLHPTSIDVLPYQLLHAYYHGAKKAALLESEYDSEISLTVQANNLEAIRGKNPAGITVSLIPSTEYVNIKDMGNCLTVSPIKSTLRDAYPLNFKPCDGSDAQKFMFVSKMAALCVLKDTRCPEDTDDIAAARAIMLKRVMEISS